MALPEIIKDIDARVKKSGDTMTGKLYTTSNLDGSLACANTNGAFRIDGGTDYQTGAFLSLNGTKSPYYPNAFQLVASNGVARKELFGNIDGTLTWDNNTILHNNNFNQYALPLTGGTMTGSIKWGNNRGMGPAASVTDFDIYAGRVSIRFEPANISGYDLKDCLFIRDTGTGQTYRFYGEHNKPTAIDIGAIPQSEMPLITVTKSITLTTDWQDTGIAFNNVSQLETGTYVIQISGINGGISGIWGDIFSGVMSWYAANTNGTDADEILLHSAGHARNNNYIFLRTLRHPGNTINIKLQIKATANATSAANITFKFRRLI